MENELQSFLADVSSRLEVPGAAAPPAAAVAAPAAEGAAAPAGGQGVRGRHKGLEGGWGRWGRCFGGSPFGAIASMGHAIAG